jgi:hypothetical protein
MFLTLIHGVCSLSCYNTCNHKELDSDCTCGKMNGDDF